MNIEISDEMAIELSDAHIAAAVGRDVKRLVDIVGALLVYIPDPRGARVPVRELPPVVERVVVKPKGRLTASQREVYGRLVQLSRRRSDPWVADTYIGSKNTCDRLAEKGWIHIDVHYGPRGGARRFYRPVDESSTAMSTPVDNGSAS